ncbi:MAG: carboxypeptidase regulatory-like domain-containing protein [Planctomycetes bacterium]|nr:carboxypeptidase regulatory-like domain-containing protein [Planctomycetota bacterium]
MGKRLLWFLRLAGGVVFIVAILGAAFLFFGGDEALRLADEAAARFGLDLGAAGGRGQALQARAAEPRPTRTRAPGQAETPASEGEPDGGVGTGTGREETKNGPAMSGSIPAPATGAVGGKGGGGADAKGQTSGPAAPEAPKRSAALEAMRRSSAAWNERSDAARQAGDLGRLVVTVLDTEGAKVAAATVSVYTRRFFTDLSGHGLAAFQKDTDDTGSVTFEDVPSGAYEVWAEKAEAEGVAEELRLARGQSLPVTITLRRGNGTIKGLLVLHKPGQPDAPIAGAILWAYSGDGEVIGSSETDKGGHFRLANLPTGFAYVGVRRLPGAFDQSVDSDLVRATVGATNLVVPAFPADILVRVAVKQPNGQPAPGAEVLAYRAEDDAAARAIRRSVADPAVTDERGECGFGLFAAGRIVIEAADGIFGPVVTEVEIPLKAEPGKEPPPVVVTLTGGAALSGRVIDADSKAPIEDAMVRLVNVARIGGKTIDLSGSTAILTVSTADGRFRLTGLPAGEARVAVEHEEYTTETLTIPLPADQTTERDLALIAHGGALKGTAWTDTGLPLPNARVTLTVREQIFASGSPFRGRATWTNARGEYEMLRIPPGSYVVTLEPPAPAAGQPPQNEADESRRSKLVDLGYGETETVDFGSPFKPSIRGTMRVGGLPRPNNHVYLARSEGSARTNVAEAITGEDGAFTFPDLAAGEYYIYTEWKTATVNRSATLDPGEREEVVDLTVEETGLRATMVNSKGEKVKEGDVFLERYAGDEFIGSVADMTRRFAGRGEIADGVVELTGLTAGTYRLRLAPWGTAYVFLENVEVHQGLVSDLGTITGPPDHAVAGKITLPDGSPAVDVRITALDSKGRYLTVVAVEKSKAGGGAYDLWGLDRGEYTVMYDKAGYQPIFDAVTVGDGNVERNFALASGPTVVARVTDPTGAVVKGLQVKLMDAAGHLIRFQVFESDLFKRTDVTDGRGRVTFPSVAPGATRVLIDNPKWAPVDQTFEAPASGEFVVEVAVAPRKVSDK